MSIYAIELKDKKDLKKYTNKWVALSAKTRELISSAVSAKEALKIALSKGEKDPILTHIPKRFDSYVLCRNHAKRQFTLNTFLAHPY